MLREFLHWLLKLTLVAVCLPCGAARRRCARPAAAPRRYWVVRRGLTVQVSPDVLPFSPQYPLWSDGAAKRRWIWLPPGTSIDAGAARRLGIPASARSCGRNSRTATCSRRATSNAAADGEWRFGSYVWSADGKDAVLAPASGMRDLPAPNAPGARYTIPVRGRLPRLPRGRAGAGAGLQRAAVVARSRSAGAACRTRRGRRRSAFADGARPAAQSAGGRCWRARRASRPRRRPNAPPSVTCMATAATATTTKARSRCSR